MKQNQKHHSFIVATLIFILIVLILSGCNLLAKDPIEGTWDKVGSSSGGILYGMGGYPVGYSEAYEFADGSYTYVSNDPLRIPQMIWVTGTWYLLGSTYTLEEDGTFFTRYAWFVGDELRIGLTKNNTDYEIFSENL